MIPALALGLALFAPQQGGDANQEMELTVDRLHVGDGSVLVNATVTIRDGKIVSVTGGAEGEGDGEGQGDTPGAELTPGLVDPYSYMGVGPASLEESRETTPSLRVAASLDLDEPAFRSPERRSAGKSEFRLGVSSETLSTSGRSRGRGKKLSQLWSLNLELRSARSAVSSSREKLTTKGGVSSEGSWLRAPGR